MSSSGPPSSTRFPSPISMSTSSSSSSGITSRLAKDVWRRRDASKGEIRTSRCTPRSADSRPYAWGPERMNVALLIPASSPGSTSSSSTRKPRRSAHRRYIRRSISAQSWDSVPPAPAWMLATASLSSYSPPSSDSSSRRSTSLSSDSSRRRSSAWRSRSSSSDRSSSMARASARRRARASYRSASLRSRARRVVRSCARGGSSHRSGADAAFSSSSACARLRSTSKVLLRRREPFGELLDAFGVFAHERTWYRPRRIPIRTRGAVTRLASSGGGRLGGEVGHPGIDTVHGVLVPDPRGDLPGPGPQLGSLLPGVQGLGALGRAFQVGQGLRRLVAPVVVERQLLEVLLDRFPEDLLLERRGDPRVQLAPPGGDERRQRRLLDQHVPERALQLGIPAELPDDLGPQKLRQVLGRVAVVDAFEHPHREAPPHHRGGLGQVPGPLRQPVDPGDEQSLQAGRQQARGGRRQGPGAAAVRHPALHDGAEQLLDVQRVPSARLTISARVA